MHPDESCFFPPLNISHFVTDGMDLLFQYVFATYVEPKFLLLLLLLDVGSYFPRFFFDVFCPFYNVSLVNGSSILQRNQATKKQQKPRNQKSQKPHQPRRHKLSKAKNPKAKKAKLQKPKKTRASNPRLQSNENAL